MMCCPACEIEWGATFGRCPECGRHGKPGLLGWAGNVTNRYRQPPATWVRPLSAVEVAQIRANNPTLEPSR